MSTGFDLVEPYPGWAREDRGPLIVTVTITLTAVAFLFVAARISSRLISLGRLHIDDCIVIVSIMLGIANVVLVGISVSHGTGRHPATLMPKDLVQATKYMLLSFLPGILSFAVPKLAVVILLVKIPHPGPRHQAVLWVTSVLYFALLAVLLALTYTPCTPMAAMWGEVQGTCRDQQSTLRYALFFAIISALFDVYLAVYPTIVLYRLIMNWKKKLALSSALGFGYCAGAVAGYKCYTLTLPPPGFADSTFEASSLVLWTSIEGNCVVIGACIPCLFPLVKKIFGTSALSVRTSDGRRRSLGRPFRTLLTVGALTGGKRRLRRSFGLSALNTIDHEGKCAMPKAEGRSAPGASAEARAEEGTASNSNEDRGGIAV